MSPSVNDSNAVQNPQGAPSQSEVGSPRQTELQYMPQLDGLRTLAVLGVLPVHFLASYKLRQYVDTGNLGVMLFFVLSGYLIAGMLLKYRDRLDRGEASLRSLLRIFYVRRFLRLFPVYYLYLAFALIAIPGVNTNLIWFLTYTQNFLFALHPIVFTKYLAHFWTLAIEEQFYLIAPILLLMIPRTSVVRFAAGLVVLGVLFRALALLLRFDYAGVHFMMPAHLQTLGMGMLLAALRWQYGLTGPAERLASWGLRLGVPLTAICMGLGAAGRLPVLCEIWADLGLALVFVWLIARASIGFDGPVGRLLQCRPLTFVGKISYGVYVYHFNVPGISRGIVRHFGLSLPGSELFRFTIYTAISIAIAAASWHFMERPISTLKSRLGS
jgi:peptidoglycan/LPS O-acetylase OafA/YrhL